MEVLDTYLNEIFQCTNSPVNEQLVRLSNLLDINPAVNPYIVRINNLPFLQDKYLNDLIDGKHFYKDEWLAFNEVVISFIRLGNQLNPWSSLESFDLYTTYMNDLSVAFNNANRGYLITYLVKNTIRFVIPMATKLDYQLYYKENCMKPRLAYLASILLKIFNNIRSQLSGDASDTTIKVSSKSSIILYIGIKLCQTYFKISNPLLCRNIFSNMNNANLVMGKYDVNEQIQYRFYLGRFYFLKNQLVDAYTHLLWCLLRCPVVPDSSNITRILQYLLPISIAIGKRPNFSFLQQMYYSSPNTTPSFFTIYLDISHAVSLGNYARFYTAITSPSVYTYLKDTDLLVLLSSKCVLLVIRNLIKRLWVIAGKVPKLDYDSIKLGLSASVSLPDGTPLTSLPYSMHSFVSHAPDDLTIENILISLIDQNLLKGKLFPRLRVVSLSKVNVFPPVDHINFLRFGNGPEGSLNASDRWLNN